MPALFDNGMLDPYGDYASPMAPQQFQYQQPARLSRQQQPQPQMQDEMMNPQNMAWGAALQNIGNIAGGRAPSQSIGGAYARGKAYNDRLRQNKAATQRQADMDERQKQQDELNSRYKSLQAQKLEKELSGIGGDQLGGQSLKAQAINRIVSTYPPELQERARNDLLRQELEREKTLTTPFGTEVTQGFTLPIYGDNQAQAQGLPAAEIIPDKRVIPKPLTGEQAKASGFGDRMIGAQSEIDSIFQESPNFNPAAVGNAIASEVPILGNMMVSPEFQRYKQASDDWIRAKLRRESGAVIGKEEAAAEYRQYFPKPGDGPEVIEQKRRSRKQAEEAMLKGIPDQAENKPARKRLKFNRTTGGLD